MARSGAHGIAERNDDDPKHTFWERLGGALFRARSATPVVLIAVALLWPTTGGIGVGRAVLAATLVGAGEACRMRAVGVAGKCTRTRGTNVKELVTSGPFAHVRNPLYLGNFMLAYGLVVLSKVTWLAWAFPVAFFVQYSAIVAWEERTLARAFGEEYERYRGSVPAWIASPRRYEGASSHAFSKDIAWRSERDSLRAVAILVLAFALKHLVFHQQLTDLVAGAARAMGLE